MTGSTNLTRFGVWSSSTLAFANANAVADDLSDENAFAYSQLDATKYNDANDPSYPGGGSARYTGETVAVLGSNHYTGAAEVEVNWTPDTVGGTMSLVVSDLRQSNGDRLTFVDGIAGGSTADGLTAVTRLIFTAVTIEADLGTVEAGTATLSYDAANLARIDGAGDSEVHAQFVGQDIDGPLGVIGRWFVSDGTNLAGPIVGGFGAEVAP